MAEPSRSGWHGLSKEKRVCAGCGEKLTLAKSGSLWFDEFHGKVYHHPCYILARQAA